MDNINLVETFAEFKEFKNIDREMMMVILEDIFRHMLERKYGSDDNFDIIVNIDKGDLEIWRNREIVDDAELEDENLQIALSDAIKIEPDFEVGEEVSEELKLEDFGRREILSIRQNLIAKIQEYEKDTIYQKYKEKIGEIVTGEVYQIWKKEILVLDDDYIELTLPKTEQIPSDFYRKGDTIRAVVSRVEMKNSSPSIVLSRTSPIFLERLFESEVPEVYDGLITIKNIVRVPGERAKIAVESYDDRIDPVGACVGMKGSRIHGIVRELKNENIDVINFTNNPTLFITRALSPAKISSITIIEESKRAEVYMKPDQVSLAIGKGGYNIRLAG
ncbi:MAG: transcription termination/antitermination protein NusA, partial [Bacteroidales bacterium]|nr:transcription termination/antitermination protein NusA [Bacteroidales bacterium]